MFTLFKLCLTVAELVLSSCSGCLASVSTCRGLGSGSVGWRLWGLLALFPCLLLSACLGIMGTRVATKSAGEVGFFHCAGTWFVAIGAATIAFDEVLLFLDFFTLGDCSCLVYFVLAIRDHDAFPVVESSQVQEFLEGRVDVCFPSRSLHGHIPSCGTPAPHPSWIYGTGIHANSCLGFWMRGPGAPFWSCKSGVIRFSLALCQKIVALCWTVVVIPRIVTPACLPLLYGSPQTSKI